MKIFAIRDESSQEQKDLAYLLYYEQEKRFYIELPENADAWETPLLLDSFVKRGETTVNSYWSKIWVQQRIVPPDRQNIGEILRDNHLKEYDEYALLMLAMGRCAQDEKQHCGQGGRYKQQRRPQPPAGQMEHTHGITSQKPMSPAGQICMGGENGTTG